MRDVAFSMFTVVLAVSTSADRVAAAEASKPVPKLTYDEHVAPILRDKCFNCHNQDKKSGGLILNNYAKLMEGGSGGQIVEPGNPDGSKMFLVVSHQEQPYMPPKAPKLPDEMIATVKK